ncbi:hypothetical protein [Algiphilus sp.]|uniref:hypothetical protein n=1 Tax=Algiphilus sp. TaxID=1872431 RepID=UPI003CCBF3C6
MAEYIAHKYQELPAYDIQPVRHQAEYMTRVEDGVDEEGETVYRDIGPVVVTFSDVPENMTVEYQISEDGTTKTGSKILADFGIS